MMKMNDAKNKPADEKPEAETVDLNEIKNKADDLKKQSKEGFENRFLFL